MKWLFTTFCKAMDRLSENSHAQKCAYIFMCVCMSAAVVGGICALFSTQLALWAATCTAGFVLLGMVRNYRTLWSFVGPSLDATPQKTSAPAEMRVALHSVQPTD